MKIRELGSGSLSSLPYHKQTETLMKGLADDITEEEFKEDVEELVLAHNTCNL